jgi:helicase MOV-10
LNYVYNNGGWRGPNPDWDTTVEVDMNGGYDAAIRERAQVDMNEITSRIEALMKEEFMEDDDAGVDQPWRDVE